MTIVPGTHLGRYEIRSKIGEGGMGEVYLAEDTALGRLVAVKVLPPETISDEHARKRLVREARAAATLDHPNICSIYEVGEVDGRRFIAMQYVEGETLDVKVKRKPLDLSESLAIAAQVADALAEAHAHGIIHRDIKPANIMITSRRQAKVMDFGLAKVIPQAHMFESEAETEALLSTPGAIMGTLPYMSPEQVRAEVLDGRSDIFSFGVILYEMVSGKQPFVCASSAATASAILTRELPPLARYSRDVPAELERIVSKALHKDKEERYQTAKDLLIDLKRLKQKLVVDAAIERSAPIDLEAEGSEAKPTEAREVVSTATGAAGQAAVGRVSATSSAEYIVTEIKQHRLAAALALLVLVIGAVGLSAYLHARNAEVTIESIAVLPFVNQNHDPDSEYLSDGVTESIINSLTQLPNLKVIARSSVFRYKGKEADPMAAGKELGVRAVLTGRIMQRGDRLTISTELLDVLDNKQLWGEQYERKVSDLLAVQREIAQEITSNLRLKLSGPEQSRVAKHYTENPEAYQLYLKGRFYWNKRTEEAITKAIECFQQAIQKDSNYALAYTGLADSYSALVFPVGAVTPREAMPKAKEAAMRALAIDNMLAEAHASLAFVKFNYDWDWPGAETEFKRAIELNPNNADAHHWYSHYLMAQGRIEESLTQSKRALELGPLDILLNIHLGWHYLYARQYDQALDQIEKTVEMDKNFAQTYPWLGLILEQKGRYAEAIAAFQKAIKLFPGGSSIVEAELAHTYAVSGNREEAQKIIADLQELAKRKYVSSYQIAAIYAGLGEKDQAFAWLEKAHHERSDGLVNLKAEQRFDSLRSDSRFADLLRRVGLPQ